MKGAGARDRGSGWIDGCLRHPCLAREQARALHLTSAVVSYASMKQLSLVVLAVFISVAALAAQKFDLTGEWVFEVQTDQGSGSPTIVLKQQGDKLTGKYNGQLGEGDITGTVTGKTFKFSFSGNAQGTEFTVTYDGEIASSDSVSGKVDLAGMATGTFTGKKKK